MKNIVKKMMIYSMVGIMQIGMSASIVSASPISNYEIVQLSNHSRQDNDRQREHDKRLREENKRHDQEMKRKPGENERDWHERQKREKERHDQALKEIASFLLGVVVGSSNN